MRPASRLTLFRVGAHSLNGAFFTDGSLPSGVMRFLQTEWHRHERDRNAWEIERAEMKSRIGRLEGEGKTTKRLHESLGKHVKILEIALKKEREKVKSLAKGEQVDFQKDTKEIAREGLRSIGKGEKRIPAECTHILTYSRYDFQRRGAS